MKQLQENTAVVTGADREPGRGIAQYLARLGVKVICDTAGQEQIRAVVQKAAECFGSVDILLNAAGFLPECPSVPAEAVRQEELNTVWIEGPAAALLWMQECFPYMKAQGEGRIIHLIRSGGDVSAVMVQGAVRALTGAAAVEWERYGICVNCVVSSKAKGLGPVAAFLGGPDSRFYSGKCLVSDGGSYSVLP